MKKLFLIIAVLFATSLTNGFEAKAQEQITPTVKYLIDSLYTEVPTVFGNDIARGEYINKMNEVTSAKFGKYFPYLENTIFICSIINSQPIDSLYKVTFIAIPQFSIRGKDFGLTGVVNLFMNYEDAVKVEKDKTYLITGDLEAATDRKTGASTQNVMNQITYNKGVIGLEANILYIKNHKITPLTPKETHKYEGYPIGLFD